VYIICVEDFKVSTVKQWILTYLLCIWAGNDGFVGLIKVGRMGWIILMDDRCLIFECVPR